MAEQNGGAPGPPGGYGGGPPNGGGYGGPPGGYRGDLKREGGGFDDRDSKRPRY